jgi:hypothetical protein
MEDLFLQITYDIKNDKFSHVTNIKEDMLDDIVGEFLRSEMGLGKDTAPANEQDIYKIRINCDLSDDTFYVKSDTGNKGLTTGIVMHFLNSRKKQSP